MTGKMFLATETLEALRAEARGVRTAADPAAAAAAEAAAAAAADVRARINPGDKIPLK